MYFPSLRDPFTQVFPYFVPCQEWSMSLNDTTQVNWYFETKTNFLLENKLIKSINRVHVLRWLLFCNMRSHRSLSRRKSSYEWNFMYLLFHRSWRRDLFVWGLLLGVSQILWWKQRSNSMDSFDSCRHYIVLGWEIRSCEFLPCKQMLKAIKREFIIFWSGRHDRNVCFLCKKIPH